MSSSADVTPVVSLCPGCGRPRPVEGTPTQRCEACGGVHPVPADVLRAAQAYRAARANMPLQLRESADITLLAAGAQSALRGFRIAAGLMGAPLALAFVIGCLLASGRSFDVTRERAFVAPGLMAPLVVLVIVGWLVRRELAARRTAIESLMWARPIADVPGAFACRMCSAPIEANEATSASVACRYCGTPNMVSAEVSRNAAKLALVDYSAHASAVLARATRRWQGWGALAFAAPVVIGAILYFGGASWARKRAAEELPLDPNATVQRTTCPDYSYGILSRTAFVPPYHACSGDATPRTVTVQPLGALVGAAVGCDPTWEKPGTTIANAPKLKVSAVFVDGLGRPKVRVDAGFGLRGVCLVEGLEVALPRSGPQPKAFTPEDAPKPAAAPEAPLDAPAWPTHERRASLVWRVPVAPAAADGMPADERPLELLVRIGAVSHRVSLGALPDGRFDARLQGPCLKTKPDAGVAEAAVSRLAMGTGGDYGYLVRRDAGTLAIASYSEDKSCSDDAGTGHPCTRAVILRRVALPERVALDERFVTVDAKGRERPLVCK